MNSSSDIDISNESDSSKMIIPDYEVEAIARCLLPKIQEYFESAEGKSAFQKWQKEKTK